VHLAVRAPVVDRTGFDGVFDVDLQYTLSWELTASPDATVSPDAVSIFTAVQGQLGLKLQADRGPFEVMVIDSIQRPTPD
jgi:uncharacterized protein (TIGR03435 family)